MELRYSYGSPYVRKVRIALHELGLENRVSFVFTWVQQPNKTLEALRAVNPLGKIPTLVTDDGEVLYDSVVILEYLDSLHDGPTLIPPSGNARWRALRLQALGDGMLDSIVALLFEERRKAEHRWDAWVHHHEANIARSLDVLEREAALLGGAITVGQIAVGTALGFLDFRFAPMRWRDGRPALADWFARFAERPSMTATMPAMPPPLPAELAPGA
ncbi:MAG: glutathione S-transferase [Alphaproteobacteria bacterium]|nr:glutathione S-transferase [Alphaproteobacteria bacterium]